MCRVERSRSWGRFRDAVLESRGRVAVDQSLIIVSLAPLSRGASSPCWGSIPGGLRGVDNCTAWSELVPVGVCEERSAHRMAPGIALLIRAPRGCSWGRNTPPGLVACDNEFHDGVISDT